MSKNLNEKLIELCQTAHKIKFNSWGDNLALNGLFIQAKKSSPKLIIFCYGRGDCIATFLTRYIDLALALQALDFNLFFFDFRGHGDSTTAPYSYGYFEQFDVLGALNYFTSNYPSINQIGILGYSLGAMAALLATEKFQIKALIIESGYSSFEKVAQLYNSQNVLILPGMPEHSIEVEKFKKAQGWTFQISAEEAIKKLQNCAIFFIDGSYEAEDNQFMFKLANCSKKLWLIPNIWHGNAYLTAKSDYEKKVITFFKKFMR